MEIVLVGPTFSTILKSPIQGEKKPVMRKIMCPMGQIDLYHSFTEDKVSCFKYISEKKWKNMTKFFL